MSDTSELLGQLLQYHSSTRASEAAETGAERARVERAGGWIAATVQVAVAGAGRDPVPACGEPPRAPQGTVAAIRLSACSLPFTSRLSVLLDITLEQYWYM